MEELAKVGPGRIDFCILAIKQDNGSRGGGAEEKESLAWRWKKRRVWFTKGIKVMKN